MLGPDAESVALAWRFPGVSDKDFEQAEQSYENARLSYEALSKNHSAIGQSITAPIAGYVKSILVKEGDYVTTGQALMTLTQIRRLQLRADVSERYYGALKQITSAHFKTPYDDKVYAFVSWCLKSSTRISAPSVSPISRLLIIIRCTS